MPAPPDDSAEAAQLNELARLYSWRVFNQRELELMTNYPRQAVSAAFNDPEFPSQFGQSRPEILFTWISRQPVKIRTKEI